MIVSDGHVTDWLATDRAKRNSRSDQWQLIGPTGRVKPSLTALTRIGRFWNTVSERIDFASPRPIHVHTSTSQ
jgi:hypothetical protein